MTYEILSRYIAEMSEEQRKMDVTIFDEDLEFTRVDRLTFADESNDVLDKGHPFLAL